MSHSAMSWACNVAGRRRPSGIIELPIFLCPALLGLSCSPRQQHARAKEPLRCAGLLVKKRPLHSMFGPFDKITQHSQPQKIQKLPQQCPGCGALSQTLNSQEPGFYSLGRKTVKGFLTGGLEEHAGKTSLENEILAQSLQSVDSEVLKFLHFDMPPRTMQKIPAAVCDRCHQLLHHQNGVSIHHPSIESIQDTIMESPHKHNHIYHVIDAADFPMSLIPQLHQLLNLTPQRSLNRRSRTEKFYHGRKYEVSFIITRSDLLAPLKAQVDSLMPYLVSVLRDALGSVGKDVRLGNVRCVSAKRGWWTKELKEEVWNRGGGGWMVGKVNVGKSQLFESVFPKGRRGTIKLDEPHVVGIIGAPLPAVSDKQSAAIEEREDLANPLKLKEMVQDTGIYDNFSLLPPLQPEVDYPAMPLVSSLPGTTVSPIRVPFGNGKGELIDLPGLSRGDLEHFVQESHRPSLVLRSRITPEQQVIKPGQSLLLGGFIRITPMTPDVIILAYAFTPISPHLTSTDKAIDIQLQERESGVENIAIPGVGEKIRSAGEFSLKWDVTKQRSGPITSPGAIGIKVDKLPYRVLSTDILIEGCGWVELVAQIRKKVLESDAVSDPSKDGDSEWPEVEVFSPEGRFIAARRPLGAWVLGGNKKKAAGIKGRPRKSMKGAKKKLKALKRMTAS